MVVNGDGVWHLIWGRALADGTLESFATGPTPHPSLLVLGAATSLLGDEASYVVTYVLFGPLAFGVLVAAVFEVARRLSSQLGRSGRPSLILGDQPRVLVRSPAPPATTSRSPRSSSRRSRWRWRGRAAASRRSSASPPPG